MIDNQEQHFCYPQECIHRLIELHYQIILQFKLIVLLTIVKHYS